MAGYRLNALPWSVGFIAGGILLLLFNLGVFARYEQLTQFILAVLLAGIGVAFLLVFLSSRQRWWPLIPGWTLLALAGMIYLSAASQVESQQTAPILFLGLACAFAHIYLLDRAERWWAIIPGGFLLVLAVVIAVSNAITHLEILLIGMGLVFFLLYLLDDRRRQWWALIPGFVLTGFGLFVFAATNQKYTALVRWWPLLLVLVGIGIGWQMMRRSPEPALTVNHAPRLSFRNRRFANPAPRSAPKTGLLSTESTRPAPGASIEILPDE
ncbi:MAG: hypothetical protein U0350_06820 [Caldilineaceae bacterium]